jgi:hypothetical protein
MKVCLIFDSEVYRIKKRRSQKENAALRDEYVMA